MRSWLSRLALLGLLLGSSPVFAQSRIDQLGAGGAVSGTDTVAACQGCGAAVSAVKTTMAQILTYIQANILVPISTGVSGLGTGVATALGTAQGNGTKVQLSTGAGTSGKCVEFDANGNTVVAVSNAACGAGGGGGISTVTDGTHSQTSATTASLGAGLVTTTGSSGTAPINVDTTVIAELAVNNAFTKGQAVTPVTLTDAATIAVDASVSNNFTVTLGGNRTLGNPSNLKAGQTLNFWITQGSGGQTIALSSQYQAPGGSATLVLSTTASAKDLLSCISDSTTSLTCNLVKAIAH